MSNLLTVLHALPALAELQTSELVQWLPDNTSAEALDNYYGNRLLYPQTLTIEPKHQQWDLVIIKAAIARQKDKYCSLKTNRITIPEEFITFVGDYLKVAQMFIDVCKPQAMTVVQTKPGNVIGTIIVPSSTEKKGAIVLQVGAISYQAPLGTLSVIPIHESKVDLHFWSNVATLNNENDTVVQVAGGPLGIIIDGRN